MNVTTTGVVPKANSYSVWIMGPISTISLVVDDMKLIINATSDGFTIVMVKLELIDNYGYSIHWVSIITQ